MMSREELSKIDAREVKLYDKCLTGAEIVGYEMGAYGDYQYYKLQDGSYVYTYFSIGD